MRKHIALACLSSRLAVLFPALLSFANLVVANEKSVQLETVPPGAQVEMNGNVVCTTPCSINVDGSYFGKKHTVFGSHAEEPIRVRLTKEGYVPKDAELTTGPIHWRNIVCKSSGKKCENSFDYYLLSADHFTFQLDPIQSFIGSSERGRSSEASAAGLSSGSLSTEELVRKALPAVVEIRAGDGSGSGFFVSPEGVLVTNAHVVGHESSILVTTSSGGLLQSSNIYVDQDRDLALVKVPVAGNPFLKLSVSVPGQGSDVIAIGSPGAHDVTGTLSLPNSVTKGIVSGIRRFPDSTVADVPGRGGVWIQTDATINHGNSGGPLLNRLGEVVGICTLTFTKTGTPGLNFALAASELAQILQYRFGVRVTATNRTEESGGTTATPTTTTLTVISNPAGADIEVDGVFLGSTPAELSLQIGQRSITISKKGYKEYQRTFQVVTGSKQRISVDLEADAKN